MVDGGTVRINAGLYLPAQNIKIEFSGSIAGAISYKKYLNGVEIENDADIGFLDYGVSVAYGIGKREACFDSFPYLLAGIGMKRVSYDLKKIDLPALQFGIGFSIRSGGLEFFAKFTEEMQFNTQDFTLVNGDVIALQNFNGSLEVGLNHVF